MPGRIFHFFTIVAFSSLCTTAFAQAPIRVDVDASQVARRYVHVHLQVPVRGGTVALVLPKWIPGGHAPEGKVNALGGLTFSAEGKVLTWRRDLLDALMFHVDVPAGAEAVEADLDYLPSSSSLSTRILDFNWNSVILYVTGQPARQIHVLASLKMPAGWQFATALPVETQSADTVEFKTASLETVVDSPVLMGQYMKHVALADAGPHKHFLDVAAESEADLPTDPVLIGHFTSLIAQAKRLYGSQHYRDYHFLVNASDFLEGGGLEHHESNDSHVNGSFFVDAQQQLAAGYLLPHEYSHSWCGKFRRPADLATSDYQQPMKTDLLWVYEGLDDYNADLLVTRSGLWTPEQTREYWAMQTAQLDNESGRTWRSLQDTADAVPNFMGYDNAWPSFQRAADYYPEGVLIWLEVNEIIRDETAGMKSMDDFSKIFFQGEDGVPAVKPYDEAEVMSTLNSIAPYDWKAFFQDRLNSLAPHAPMGGLERAGWRLTYSSHPNAYMEAAAIRRHSVDALYSIGIAATASGRITDALRNGPAFAAGLAPEMLITQVNGTAWSVAALNAAVAASTRVPVVLTAMYGGVSKSYTIVYSGGSRFPHLERIPGKADDLAPLLAPLD